MSPNPFFSPYPSPRPLPPYPPPRPLPPYPSPRPLPSSSSPLPSVPSTSTPALQHANLSACLPNPSLAFPTHSHVSTSKGTTDLPHCLRDSFSIHPSTLNLPASLGTYLSIKIFSLSNLVPP
ncbi:hypothetical protein Pcinc_041087 [Petrolisthes cinctipes]|uniref:Uncharacterized protein n=1 Tax=Petrolisthes cinctipes TaxID=88211 RepID=A0AAE1BP10_PETCI|nr:hypothetical protein Pcinc_041087 [Petrolisthes cinctipes]